jgi:hypothetical protein
MKFFKLRLPDQADNLNREMEMGINLYPVQPRP